MEFSDRIRRRIKLHDLDVLMTVVEAGSMGKAAALLNTTQSAISRSIADLENTMGVRLLDRSSQGVEPTMYGNALLKRGTAVFDELKQSAKDIEFLADPTTGEIKVACSVAIALTVIPHIIERFIKKFPRAVVHFDEVPFALQNYPELRDRKYDVILVRGGPLQAEEGSADDLNIEFLFDDELVIAAGAKNKWATRRRKIDLAELVSEPWILQAPPTWTHGYLAAAFQARGLDMPRASLVTRSMSVITHFLADGRFLISMPRSVVHFNKLKVLPVDIQAPSWPINIVTLKNRTLSPPTLRFIECTREIAKSLAKGRPASR
jgi:DNA-binding transcriptional LysR family regulator